MVYNTQNYWISGLNESYALVCWLASLQTVFTSRSVFVAGLCVLCHDLYCIFSRYLPLTEPGLRYFYRSCYTDMGCPVIEGSSFSKGPNRVGVTPSP
jgi:hypothetical protein